MFPTQRIDRRPAGKLATTGALNRIIDVVNGMNPPGGGGMGTPTPWNPLAFRAVIWDAGPSGEADYTSSDGGRYWVRIAYIAPGATRDAVTLDNASTSTEEGAAVDSIITATNAPETFSGAAVHSLPKNTPVYVHVEEDEGGTPHFIFDRPPPPLIPVTLAQSAGTDGSTSAAASWTYVATPVGSSTALASGAALAVTMVRPKGKTLKAGFGWAWFNGSDYVILDCDEAPDFSVKTVVTSVTCVDGVVTGNTIDILSPT